MNLPLSLISPLARYWPFANGAGRIIDQFGKQISLGEGLRTCQTAEGFKMNVLADDLIGRHLIISGQFDSSIIRPLIAFAEPGDHCIDVGANIGYMSCFILNAVPGSVVLTIEPQPEIVSLLRQNLSQFDASRWSVLAAGLSDSEATGHFKVDTANRAAGALTTDGADGTTTIPLVPAARVFSELKRLDIMKMDIEGHEETVFRSAADELQRLQPKAILFEEQLGKASPDGAIGSILNKIGYAVFGVDKQLLATRLVRLTAGIRPHYNDYIALSQSRPLPPAALARYKIEL